MAEVVKFLEYYNKRRWHVGVTDCCLFLAEWAIWNGHPDPASRLRVQYWDEAGYMRLIRAAGGLVPLVDECVKNIDGHAVQLPSCGDIGVIGSPTNLTRQFGAIFDGEAWRVRHIESVGFMTAKTLAVWRI